MPNGIQGLAKVAGIAIVIWLVEIAYDEIVMPWTTLGRGEAISFASVLLPSLAAAWLTTAALVYPTRRSALAGGRLTLAIFSIVLGIHVLLVIVEGVIFLDNVPRTDWIISGARDTIVAALLALLLTRVFGRAPRPARTDVSAMRTPGPWSWTWRTGVCAIAYVFVYITAGALIWPYIRPFYVSAGLTPNPAIILPLQIVRGTFYVLFALPLIRSLVAPRWQISLAMAVLFPILAGVAALLIPNPVFPDWVRWYHFVEIGWSNFVFGALVGFLFWNSAAGAAYSVLSATTASTRVARRAGT